MYQAAGAMPAADFRRRQVDEVDRSLNMLVSGLTTSKGYFLVVALADLVDRDPRRRANADRDAWSSVAVRPGIDLRACWIATCRSPGQRPRRRQPHREVTASTSKGTTSVERARVAHPVRRSVGWIGCCGLEAVDLGGDFRFFQPVEAERRGRRLGIGAVSLKSRPRHACRESWLTPRRSPRAPGCPRGRTSGESVAVAVA